MMMICDHAVNDDDDASDGDDDGGAADVDFCAACKQSKHRQLDRNTSTRLVCKRGGEICWLQKFLTIGFS